MPWPILTAHQSFERPHFARGDDCIALTRAVGVVQTDLPKRRPSECVDLITRCSVGEAGCVDGDVPFEHERVGLLDLL